MMIERLAALVTQHTGVELSRGGLLDALSRYVGKRRGELGISGFGEYLELVRAPDRRELNRLIEIISVPHTWFFRDPEQLALIRSLMMHLAQRERPLSIWVPGCATGEDAYSLALIADSLGIGANIVGSDICEESLTVARRGAYGAFSVRDLPEALRGKFQRSGRNWQLEESVRNRVKFVQQNLLEPALSEPDGWHVVLCRNVFIYFSRKNAEECAARLGRNLHERGVLLCGAGELIGASIDGLRPEIREGRVVYRRAGTAASEPPRTSPIAAPRGFDLVTFSAQLERSQPQFSQRESLLNEPVQPKPSASAIAHAQDVLCASAESPVVGSARMEAGIALYAAGDLDRALHELRAALVLDERLWPAAIYHGLCLESLGQPHLARAEYRHAVRMLECGDSSLSAEAFLPEELSGLGPELLEMARRKSA